MATKQPKLVDGGDYLIPSFYGLHTAVKNPKELALGQPQDSLNFITGYNTQTKNADNIQLRTGYTLLCKTRLGAGKINALAVGEDATGTQWVFFICGGQIYYYNPSTGDLATVTNGTLAATEDMTMEYYQDLFGPYVYASSPNNPISTISIANKQAVNNLSTLQMVANGAFAGVGGYLTIRQNFAWMWNYKNQSTGIVYPTNLNQSNPDQVAVSGTGISNPQGSTGALGNGVLKTFSGTLANFSALGFTVQIGAPINSLTVYSVSIPSTTPFSIIYSYSVVYNGGFQFALGDYVVLQNTANLEANMADCIGIVTAVNGTTSIAVNFLNTPPLTNTAGGINTAVVLSGGSGYVNGDVLTVTEAGANYGTLTVTSVDGGGAVTGFNITSPGIGYTASNQNTTGGHGSSCTVTIQSVSTNVSGPNVTLSKLEIFEDDSNGNLKSNLGSAGTVNYISGAFTINTQTAVPNGLNIDSICFSGVPGILTFAPGSWTQFGGVLEAIKFFNSQLYEFHTINTWLLNLGYSSQSQTTGTQQQYRQNMGAPFFRAAYEKGDGILFLDDTDQNNPHFRELSISNFNNAVEPDSLSDDLDLSQNDFSQCVVNSVGNYDFLACKSLVNGVAKSYNDTTYVRNNISGFWDKTDLRIVVMDTYNGSIIAGDTISQNVYVLFSGVDDDGAPINAYWTSGQMNLGSMGLKQFGLFHVDGFIGPSQVFNIYAQYDTGNYVLIGSVYGNGKYVDQNNSILIGQGLNGTQPIGGAGNGQVYGYYFTQDIPIWTPLFQYVSIKFVPGINLITKQPAFGALQINANFGFRDVRIKSVKAPANTIGK